MKIAMIGAGSVVFVKNLLTDILSAPELASATIALHDIDQERLDTGVIMARWTATRLRPHLGSKRIKTSSNAPSRR